jgi:hypothetical protein
MWKKITKLIYGKGKDETGQEVDRLEHLEMTLSAGDPDTPKFQKADVKIKPALAARIKTAAAELASANIAAAERWGLGTETDFSFDQDDGQLKLVFENGKSLAFPSQFIGSFDPSDNSFLWAWANPSLAENLTALARSIKEQGTAQGEAILTTAKQGLNFDEITQLVAFAGRQGEMPLVYRCIVNGHVSLFLALGEPEHFDAKGKRVASMMTTNIGRAEREAADARVAAFDKDCFAANADKQSNKGKADALKTAIASKMIAYQRDWSRNDDYWEPSSAGWPSDHDTGEDQHRFVIPHIDGAVLCVRVTKEAQRYARRVEWIGGTPKITDEIIGWGAGFMWPQG